MAAPSDLLQGTLDLLILKVLELGPQHGWAISQRIHDVSEKRFFVNQGSLYPALHRLEGKGFIDADWVLSPTSRRVRTYRLRAKGKRELATQKASWARYARGMQLVLEAR